jgi:hypothetical protein
MSWIRRAWRYIVDRLLPWPQAAPGTSATAPVQRGSARFGSA